MKENLELPQAIDMEKQLISAMLLKEGEIVPKVATILNVDDLYRPEHQLIFRTIMRLYSKSLPIDYPAIEEELRKSSEFEKFDHSYLLQLVDATHSTANAEYHAKTIKEKSDLRTLFRAAQKMAQDASSAILNPQQIIAAVQKSFDGIINTSTASSKSSFPDFFANHFATEVEQLKNYAQRKTGFDNLDQQQFFNPGLYVIGATPAAGKTTFCWQLLEQLARRGEQCIYCSYEMSRFELFSKSLARELFKRNPSTALTAADIRRGSWSAELEQIVKDFGTSSLNLHIFELQDESIDDLLALLRPLCQDKSKAPVVCLDYLQIVPSFKDSPKVGIDESVRKLKKFQRDTNTTFIVISSFNRANYTQTVSFESFKESGNIEYTADVVWALQLNALNSVNAANISDARRRIEEAKKKQPRQIQLKCLKNRQGTNYECFFNYYSAHDCFQPCNKFNEEEARKDYKTASEGRIKNGKL